MIIIQKTICQDATLCTLLAMFSVSTLWSTFYQEKTLQKEIRSNGMISGDHGGQCLDPLHSN